MVVVFLPRVAPVPLVAAGAAEQEHHQHAAGTTVVAVVIILKTIMVSDSNSHADKNCDDSGAAEQQ